MLVILGSLTNAKNCYLEYQLISKHKKIFHKILAGEKKIFHKILNKQIKFPFVDLLIFLSYILYVHALYSNKNKSKVSYGVSNTWTVSGCLSIQFFIHSCSPKTVNNAILWSTVITYGMPCHAIGHQSLLNPFSRVP